MTKILHTADIHLDSPLRSLALRDPELFDMVQAATRGAFRRIVDIALDAGAAALLISGDLFDGAARSAQTAAFLISELDRLRAAEVRVFYIKGNHDAENPLTGETALPANVHVFDGRGGKVALADDIWIHGVSYAGRAAPESLLPKFPAPVPDAVNIAMLHTSLAGAAGHDTYAPCTPGELAAMAFDYWALGHVHRRQIHGTDPLVVMPGCPQGRDIGETGPKSATMITVGSGLGIAEVPTSGVEFLHRAVALDDLERDDEIRDRLRQDLSGCAARLTSDTGILRLTLTGTTPRHWQILRDREQWRDSARRIARETGRLWLESLELDLAGPAAPKVSASDELEQLMAGILREPGTGDGLRAEVEAVLGELPAHRRAALLAEETDATRLTETLAERGADLIGARIRGAGS